MYSWYDMIEEMKAWIDDNIDGDPSLTEMARRLGYSYFYATKKFHEIEGVSFREYMLNRKIQKAASDIYLTDERVIDIAIKYGYSSQEAFTRAFVKMYNIAPAAYRRMKKPNSFAQKNELLSGSGQTKPNLLNGGTDMKIYVKQMGDWNCYAYYAEDVDEQYFDYFKSGLWWQIGNSFIKPYDNVQDFKYCAENFTKYGEISIKQQLKIIETPWDNALKLFIAQMKKIDVPWYTHGSVAMALWGIDVKPRDVNIIVPNYSDFEKVRNVLYKYATVPIERCDNWVMSGGGSIFMEAEIGVWFHNKELEPYDMSALGTVKFNGEDVYLSTLDMLKQDNEFYGRPERVALIEKQQNHTA